MSGTSLHLSELPPFFFAESLSWWGWFPYFFNLHWPSCRGDGVNSTDPSFWGPAFSQAQICACSPGADHGLSQPPRGQRFATECSKGSVQGWGSGGGAEGEQLSVVWAVAQKPGTEGGSQLCSACSALAGINSPLKEMGVMEWMPRCLPWEPPVRLPQKSRSCP